jgi:putative transposase
LIRDAADYTRHVEYCYINPLKHGLVSRVRDWPYSSFHRDVRAGPFPEDWGGDIETTGDFGEQ